jgi:hypothetical protein
MDFHEIVKAVAEAATMSLIASLVLAFCLHKLHTQVFSRPLGIVKVSHSNQTKLIDVCCFNLWLYSLLMLCRRQCKISLTRRAHML